MKTILFLDHTAKLSGGEIALFDLICALDRSCFIPVVSLASDGPLVGKLQDAGIETHIMPLGAGIVDTRKGSLGVKSLGSGTLGSLRTYVVNLAKWARSRGVDLIHTNSLKSDIYGGFAGRMAGIPVVWHVRDNIDANYLPRAAAALFKIVARLLPHRVIANSASTLKCLSPGDGRGAVAYSGVPRESAERSTPALASGRRAAPDAPVVAIIGRIAEWKGQHIFLQAAAEVVRQYPSARFWVIGAPLFGEYDFEKKLHSMANELGIEPSVEFLGFRNDVPELLEKIDIVVHASILGEPFGQVVVQGMAAGKPVVATQGGALPEIVVPGETGLLVPMGDAAAMADAVGILINDFDRALAMGEAGRRRVQERFTIDHTVASVTAVYEDLLLTRAPRGPGRLVQPLGAEATQGSTGKTR